MENTSHGSPFWPFLTEPDCAGSVSPRFGESFSLDWLAVIDGPSIHKVEGCIDRYHPDRNRGTSRTIGGVGGEERRLLFEDVDAER